MLPREKIRGTRFDGVPAQGCLERRKARFTAGDARRVRVNGDENAWRERLHRQRYWQGIIAPRSHAQELSRIPGRSTTTGSPAETALAVAYGDVCEECGGQSRQDALRGRRQRNIGDSRPGEQQKNEPAQPLMHRWELPCNCECCDASLPTLYPATKRQRAYPHRISRGPYVI